MMKKFLVCHWILGFLSFSMHSGAQAQELAKHSSIAVSKEKLKDGRLQFTFKVIPSEKMIINMEGPWKLDLKKHDGIEFATTKLVKSDMRETLPGFLAESNSPPAAKSGKIDYQMIVFVCTKDKGQCFRDVHKETFAW